MKLYSLILLVFFIKPVFCQKLKSQSIGINTSGFYIGETLRLISTPQFSWGNSKHKISTGPVIMLATEIAASNKNFPRFSGFQGIYRIFPNSDLNRFNLFFFNELNLLRVKDIWTSTIFDIIRSRYVKYKYQNIEYLLQNELGYGFSYISKEKIQINTKVGLGFYYSLMDGDELTAGAPEIEDGNFGFGYAKTGISYGIGFNIIYML